MKYILGIAGIISIIIGSMIMAWNTIGFTDQLTRESITAQPSQEMTGLQFDKFAQDIAGEKIGTEIAGNLVGQGISASNITTGQMSFDRAQGGSLILGGQNNQLGTFALRDDEDQDRITLDKDGMIIDRGKMTIKDKNNSLIIDSSGLVSSTQFKTGNIVNNERRTIQSTAWTDVSNTTLDFSLTRTVYVLLSVTIVALMEDMGGTDILTSTFAMNIDGTRENFLMYFRDSRIETPSTFSTQSRTYTLGYQVIKLLGNGGHTIKLQGNISNATFRLFIDASTVYYIVLGN